ncbi:unnamed protein product [Moneuplotes crassus]|uniref:Uncharacterized protein n=1 Tax=Euplotes crassus TaxID=5936 RepID=A0AAD2D3F1_EUPCR|nr:unnamed protein product [Moneuplotes crassus]
MEQRKNWEQTVVEQENGVVKRVDISEYWERRFNFYFKLKAMLEGVMAKLSPQQQKGDLRKLVIYHNGLWNFDHDFMTKVSRKKVCEGVEKANTGKIIEMRLYSKNGAALVKLDRTTFVSSLRCISKVYNKLEFSRMCFTRRQTKHLLNSIVKLSELRFCSCKIDCEDISIMPDRKIEIKYIRMFSCLSQRNSPEDTPIDLASLLICMSESSISESLQSLLLDECHFSKEEIISCSEHCSGKMRIEWWDESVQSYISFPKSRAKYYKF